MPDQEPLRMSLAEEDASDFHIEWAPAIFCCHRATLSETTRPQSIILGPVRHYFWSVVMDQFIDVAFGDEFPCFVMRSPELRDTLLRSSDYIISVRIRTPAIDQDDLRWFTTGVIRDRASDLEMEMWFEIFLPEGPDNETFRREPSLYERWTCEVMGAETTINYWSNDNLFANQPAYRLTVLEQYYIASAEHWMPAFLFQMLNRERHIQ